MQTDSTVIIVGAGPAGLGCALALRACGVTDVSILDAQGVGTSFERWPAQMRLLTPSFHSNSFGFTDLNAISPDTSPADFLHTQHPTGKQYAHYLKAVVYHYQLFVESGVRVKTVERDSHQFFVITTQDGLTRRARFVIWATGEFGQPKTNGIRGAYLGIHNSTVRDWDDFKSGPNKMTIIGGYESGIDAVINLVTQGKEVHLLSRGQPWANDDPDPSRSLSPHTHDRLKTALLETFGSIQFYQNADINRIRKVGDDYEIISTEGTCFHSPTAPILCTGFESALQSIQSLWEWRDGYPIFSEEADESTRTPGLFYSGPSLQHRGMQFCFIYKYRSRFGIIARAIASRLGLPWKEPLSLWRKHGFFQEDLNCCSDCQCAIDHEETENPEVHDYEKAVLS
jgi:putative flavoprotein involved in K+ transport